eukprot:jgi/Picre1/33390/NNA_008714.t1
MRAVSSTSCINTPEATLAKRYLIRSALEKAKHKLGPADQSAIPVYAPNQRRTASSTMYDAHPSTTYALQGKGVERSTTKCIEARDAAKQQKDKLRESIEKKKLNLIREFHTKHQDERPREPQRDIKLRDTKRRSHFVLLRDKDSEAHHVGVVYEFVRVFSPRKPDEVERYAICGIYETEKMDYHGTTVYMVKEFTGERLWRHDERVFSVPIDDIVCQVSSFQMSKDGWEGEWPHYKLVEDGHKKEMDKMLAFSQPEVPPSQQRTVSTSNDNKRVK